MSKVITSFVNKNIRIPIPSKFYNSIQVSEGISVICSTNKKNSVKNILNNFLSQTHEKKELIIILNYDNPNMDKWESIISSHNNVQVYPLASRYSLGKCLNYAISVSQFPFIAKFDDDDYYAPNYLSDMAKPFHFTDASVIGKATTYVYFSNKQILAIRNVDRDNRYVSRVEGPTLFFKKSIFNKVQFRNKNLGEDIKFCEDCIKNGFKIYSTNKDHFVYIRNDKDQHTWRIDNDYFLNNCTIISETNDFKNYILNL
ncbi:MAG: glycosyltransferase [Tissierellia bacterium]|nr:glycosyltransferase [Tissierellia bacterium]